MTVAAGRRHFLVLTAAAGVGDDFGLAARAALSADHFCAALPRRLAPTAIEIGFVGPLPEGFAAAGILAGAPVDVNVVGVKDRRARLLLADMDSTIIGVECIDELADFAGVKPEVAAITERAMRGELDFDAALRARVALLRGLPESALEQCYAERVRLNPGARTLVRTMAALGADTALVSGGFTFFTERVAAAAGFARTRANRLLAEDGHLTGEVGTPILGRAAKLAALRAFSAEGGFGPEAVLAVGDGANDLDMVVAAGLGVAYRAKPALAAAADARIEWSDLTALLALQGIPETEWQA
ncbi:phosphoserine phosphatase SerB [uncultured Amaricoccus sp.]|uniref:phosphoserine phosphatase SerB n=1 Tax=uncultured Amaricoccus sp. TaxID=339341 RepID=UPI0026297D89|nr:phosphoserine phosphatase SerB [uncultured Amaricoccus sp.]